MHNLKGIEIRKNLLNKFTVIRVHYSADPDKDPDTPKGKAWLAMVKAGTGRNAFLKEYEIDAYAKSGNLVVCEFEQKNVIEPFKIPDHWTKYMALDPGVRNPCGALWLAVDPDDEYYFYREHYVSGKYVDFHSDCIKTYENWPDFKAENTAKQEEIYFRLADPSSKGTPPRHMSAPNEGIDVMEAFRDHDINFMPANSRWQAGVNKLNQFMMKDKVTGRPRIHIFNTLTNFIWELKHYRYAEQSLVMSSKKNPAEKAREIADHLVDCARYLVMAAPTFNQIPLKIQMPRTDIIYKSTGY